MGPKKSRKIPAKSPSKFPSPIQKSPRRASAGAQGEDLGQTQEGKRHININIFSGHCPGGRGSLDWVARGQNVYVLCAKPKEHKRFRPGARPGGSVTGMTEKLFMCQVFMCLFRPLQTVPLKIAMLQWTTSHKWGRRGGGAGSSCREKLHTLHPPFPMSGHKTLSREGGFESPSPSSMIFTRHPMFNPHPPHP